MSALPFLHDRQFSPRLSLVCLVCLLLLPACPAPGSDLDGTARTELSNHGVDAPSVPMRGDSAVFMAGLQWDPAHSSLHVDLGLEGSAGVRQSIGGQARLVWEF